MALGKSKGTSITVRGMGEKPKLKTQMFLKEEFYTSFVTSIKEDWWLVKPLHALD